MTLNPYPMLLTTGVLMFATVFFTESGPSLSLTEAGAKSMDSDLSRLAAQVVSSMDLDGTNAGRMAGNEPVEGNESVEEARMASLEGRQAAVAHSAQDR